MTADRVERGQLLPASHRRLQGNFRDFHLRQRAAKGGDGKADIVDT